MNDVNEKIDVSDDATLPVVETEALARTETEAGLPAPEETADASAVVTEGEPPIEIQLLTPLPAISAASANPAGAPPPPPDAPPRPPQVVSFPPRRRSSTVTIVLLSALLGLFLSLIFLVIVNGGLRYAALERFSEARQLQIEMQQQFDAMQREINTLNTTADSLHDQVDSLTIRLDKLNQATDQLTDEQQALQQGLTATEARLADLETASADLTARMDDLTRAAESFDAFLVGMRDLLFELAGPPPIVTLAAPLSPTPTATPLSPTMTPPSGAVHTPSATLPGFPSPSVTPLPGVTPRPTRTPIPTATPFGNLPTPLPSP